MKLKYFTVLALFMVGSLFSCKDDGTYELVQGKWKAMAMDQNGEIKDLSNNDVWFKFNPNGTMNTAQIIAIENPDTTG